MNLGNVKIFLARNGIFIALLALIILFTVLNPNFLSLNNGQNILTQASELGLVALALGFLVMSGTIDLSVGSVASASAVTAGLVMSSTGSTVLGIAAGLFVGLVAGCLNGFLVSYLGLNSFVVTLGALSVWGGLAMLVSGGKTVPRSELPDSFREIGTAAVGPVPVQIVILVVAIVAAWYLLNRTTFGKQILAVGGSQRASRLMGVNVPRTRFILFVMSGVVAAFAGIMLAAKVQSASPTIGVGMELDALTVVLLGGVAFEGGVGRISGIVAGLLFFRVLRTGLVFLQASPFLQTVLVGATLILAVALDSSIQRVIRSSWAKLGKRAVEKVEDVERSEGSPALPQRR
ncbi:ribose ABC transporter permease [Subtercola boreus]|uniref:Autoinducer 2 import system permease protein LsrD n=1 Tax=Subtercola boreus TaxID=120213 RepID=A0A3E0VBK7_9MICO|nr:ABC transporter permease [Subtercola boreus]RFA06923.1 ribose ABC transporter permease [Subtercola boreus]